MRALTMLAWLGSTSLLAFVGLRITGHDGSPLVATAQSLTLYFLFPAWFALGFAIGGRKRALGALTVFLTLTHVVWLYPEVHASARIGRAERAAPSIRVFSANLYADNPDVSGLIAEVGASNADVVCLQEYSRGNQVAFERSGALDAYPYQVAVEQNSPFGAMLASKLPFRESSLADIGGLEMPRAVIETPIGPIEVFCVHANRPVTERENRRWVAQHEALARIVVGRVTPLLFAGDFNATTSHRPLRDLLDAGITDAHRARGMGLSTSWPNDQWFPPLIRVDHVLSTREIVALRVRNGTGTGTDHVPVIVDFALVGAR